MAQCTPGTIISRKQEGNLTAACYKAVKVGTSDGAVVVATANSQNVGIIYKNPDNTSDGVAIVVSGTAMAKAGGNITRGDYLISDANGDLVSSTPTDKDKIIAIALDSAVDNDILEVTVNPFTMSV